MTPGLVHFAFVQAKKHLHSENMKRQSVKEERIQDIRVSNVDSHILAGMHLSIANKTTMRI